MKRLISASAFVLSAAALAHADVPGAARALFDATTTTDRDKALAELDAARAADPLASYSAGAGHFFLALEGLAQDLHRHGFETPQSLMLPLMRMPIPPNASPEPLTYEQFRAMLSDFRDRLDDASERLASVPQGADIGIDVDLTRAGIDMDGNGAIDRATESLAGIMAAIGGGGLPTPDEATQPLTFRFDRADGYWLDGYAHVLMAQADFWLAHDFRQAFEQSFHALFPRASLPMQDALVPLDMDAEGNIFASEWRLADFVSFFHLVNWPVVEPERRKQARQDLLQMIALSRQNWQAILAETDNDREWLPGPQQPGMHALTGLQVTQNEVDAWHQALAMAEDLLEGRKLMPHFRIADRGIDMKKFFEEPTTFDLVLSITGPGVVPYLRQGPMLTSEEFWGMANRFESFMAFAIWFN
ncbi:MAG: hypothetical protein AB7S80_08225 [Rhizobiaceae bacterium]